MSRHVQSCRHGILSSLKDIRALFDKLNDLGLIIMIIIIIITIININLVIVIILLLHYDTNTHAIYNRRKEQISSTFFLSF